jgi:ribosomal protein L11 methyltransferase
LADSPAIEIAFAAPADPALFDRLYARLDDFGPVAIHDDEAEARWRVFFRSSSARDAALTALAGLPGLTASALDVPDEDWARRSQENLRAIEAGGLMIAPPWDVPGRRTEDGGRRAEDGGSRAEDGGSRTDLPVIIIEPSTGFGTGHHATTRLCLRMLRQLELRAARVLDVGTGSGVLALAAWKLGASDVVAIDNDPDALENARDNIARNGAGPSIDVICDDLGSLRIQRADIVLANLTGAVLMRYADELRSLAVEGGYLILSGFAPQDAAVVLAAFKGVQVIDETVEGDWAALSLRRV